MTDNPLADIRHEKFSNPTTTLDGSARASIGLERLRTLWFNTGTLCNLACKGCYIESSPKNDRLSYLTLAEVEDYLNQIRDGYFETEEIGFTGGEPFMNPDILEMIELSLDRGFSTLVLTNAMRPMARHAKKLAPLASNKKLSIRVSLDHHHKEGHEHIRGPRSWDPAIEGIRWLSENGFQIDIASRRNGEDEAVARAGFAKLFDTLGTDVDASDPGRLVLFPEMDPETDVPEITEACWGILDVDPKEIMCGTSRMIVRRKGSDAPSVVPCTLLPYDEDFDLGPSLAGAKGDVLLNHPFCAQFCVLGGASCSAS